MRSTRYVFVDQEGNRHVVFAGSAGEAVFVVNGRAGVRNGDKPLMEEDIKSTTVVDLPVPTHEATEAYERSLQ